MMIFFGGKVSKYPFPDIIFEINVGYEELVLVNLIVTESLTASIFHPIHTYKGYFLWY